LLFPLFPFLSVMSFSTWLVLLIPDLKFLCFFFWWSSFLHFPRTFGLSPVQTLSSLILMFINRYSLIWHVCGLIPSPKDKPLFPHRIACFAFWTVLYPVQFLPSSQSSFFTVVNRKDPLLDFPPTPSSRFCMGF